MQCIKSGFEQTMISWSFDHYRFHDNFSPHLAGHGASAATIALDCWPLWCFAYSFGGTDPPSTNNPVFGKLEPIYYMVHLHVKWDSLRHGTMSLFFGMLCAYGYLETLESKHWMLFFCRLVLGFCRIEVTLIYFEPTQHFTWYWKIPWRQLSSWDI